VKDMNQPQGQDGFKADIFVSSNRWNSAERDAAEREKIWPKTWQMVCREDRLPKPGSFVTHEILDDPVLIIRTGDGPDDLSAIYNVCQHRGRRLVDRGHGTLGHEITCRFHGWRYGWDGEVKHIFGEEDWEGCPSFDRNNLNVPQIRIGRWGGFVFVCLDPDVEPLEDWLAPVTQFLDPFALQDCKPSFWKRIHGPINWKTYIEAFNEGYHSGETHRLGVNYRPVRMPGAARGPHGTFWSESDSLTEYKLRGAKSWQAAKSAGESLWANMALQYDTLFALALEPTMKAADQVKDLPPDTPPEEMLGKFYGHVVEETEKTGASFPKELTIEAFINAGVDWHIFPNLVILPSLDGALVYRVVADAKDRDKCFIDIWSLGRFPDDYEGPAEPEFYTDFEDFIGACPFLEEDFSNMEAVNEGMKSRGFKGATFNPSQEAQIRHFHRMLDEYCGKP